MHDEQNNIDSVCKIEQHLCHVFPLCRNREIPNETIVMIKKVGVMCIAVRRLLTYLRPRFLGLSELEAQTRLGIGCEVRVFLNCTWPCNNGDTGLSTRQTQNTQIHSFVPSQNGKIFLLIIMHEICRLNSLSLNNVCHAVCFW